MPDFAKLSALLYTAVLSDVLDQMGHAQNAMRPFIRPVDDTLTMMGRARTGLYATTYSLLAEENPYQLEMDLVDSLKPGEVAVLGSTARPSGWPPGVNCCRRHRQNAVRMAA